MTLQNYDKGKIVKYYIRERLFVERMHQKTACAEALCKIWFVPFVLWLPSSMSNHDGKLKVSCWNIAAIFSQMNLQYHGIFCIIWRHVKVSTKRFQGKSVCPVIWWATGKEKPARFLETVILCDAILENFKRKVGSSLCYHTTSMRNCFCVCICLIFRFAYLEYYCFCAMLISISHLCIVNIFCCLCCMPCVYLRSLMLCLRSVYYLLFSKTCKMAQYLTCKFCGWTIFYDLCILV